jgi:hypothetical protein
VSLGWREKECMGYILGNFFGNGHLIPRRHRENNNKMDGLIVRMGHGTG